MTIITDNIMKKVRIIFLMRRLVTPFVFFTAACVVFVSTVSISHVIQNMPALVDIQAILKFFAASFVHTDVIVKSALVAGTVFLCITLKGIVESFRTSNSTQQI